MTKNVPTMVHIYCPVDGYAMFEMKGKRLTWWECRHCHKKWQLVNIDFRELSR